MEKCSCYDEYISFTGLKTICNGTRERDECSCGGDRKKCDFYPEIRQQAENNLTDFIIKLEDILIASNFEWEMRYNPDNYSYGFTIFKKDDSGVKKELKPKLEFDESEIIYTYRDLMRITNPGLINDFFCGGIAGCPDDRKDGKCPYSGGPEESKCYECWDRPIDHYNLNKKGE